MAYVPGRSAAESLKTLRF